MKLKGSLKWKFYGDSSLIWVLFLVITDSRDGKEKWKKALEEKWAIGAKGRKIFTHLKPTSNLWKILISCRRLKKQQILLIIIWPAFGRTVSIYVWKSNHCVTVCYDTNSSASTQQPPNGLWPCLPVAGLLFTRMNKPHPRNSFSRRS